MSIVGGMRVGSPVDVVCPRPAPIWPAGPLASDGAVHVPGPPPHGDAGEHVLRHGLLHEPLGGDHRDSTRLDVVVADDPLHPAEVVDVRVRVDHRHHGPRAAMLLVQREGGCSGLLADQRVDHDHAGLALDDAHHRQVEAAQLVDARHHLEQAVADQELSLAPQARMGGVGRRFAQELVRVHVPHDPPVGGGDLAGRRPGDEAALGVVEVLRVVERVPGGVHGARVWHLHRDDSAGSVSTSRSIGPSSSRSWISTPTITRAIPKNSIPDGCWSSAIHPISTAVTGSRASSRENRRTGMRRIVNWSMP